MPVFKLFKLCVTIFYLSTTFSLLSNHSTKEINESKNNKIVKVITKSKLKRKCEDIMVRMVRCEEVEAGIYFTSIELKKELKSSLSNKFLFVI
jgi:hypothetical protein